MENYYKLNESMRNECFKWFVCTIIVFVWPMYLKELTQVNIEQQLETHAKQKFPRMFMSLDYMHYEWNNYHVNW
jgi:hypothetical protein